MSQITTHILDTSIGRPAQGVRITLLKKLGSDWREVSSGITNQDGRIGDLLATDVKLELGSYKMVFDTKAYFESHAQQVFYPSVSIEFEVFDQSHYHIPLLLNPFGYSTYRGS
jgi:5-hydroxyisourate hydrolase